MLHNILDPIITWMASIMIAVGPIGVTILMGIESACIPLPSEIIMPFAGFLAYKNQMAFLGFGENSPFIQIFIVGFFGAIGCNIGSVPAYELGSWSGNRFVTYYGKFIGINTKHLNKANRFFERFDTLAILLGRMLPIIRTFIAFPAGVSRMNRTKFHIYTFIGSLIWCISLSWSGYCLSDNWNIVNLYFKKFDLILFISVLIIFSYIIIKRYIFNRRQAKR